MDKSAKQPSNVKKGPPEANTCKAARNLAPFGRRKKSPTSGLRRWRH
jgi:hypothetical protein